MPSHDPQTWWDQEAADRLIPDYMHGGLRRWIEQGIVPGQFLCAVLQNDLEEAVGRADGTNINLLPKYVAFLFNYAPRGCWGSKENFEDWKNLHEDMREAKDASRS